MTDAITLQPLQRPPSCTWHIPGSKSLTNRAFIAAALAQGTSILEGVLHSDDTRYMRNALSAMGIEFKDIDETTVAVNGGRKRLHAPEASLFIGNSGTSVRFLSALASLVHGSTTLTGDEHMAKRPIADLNQALEKLGIQIDCKNGCPPLTIHGGPWSGFDVSMQGNKSSQYFSALLLVAGMEVQPLTLHITGELVSRPYVHMTMQVVHDFGGRIEDCGDHFIVHPCHSYRSRSYQIEPDASAASYAFALAAASGGSITVPYLNAECLQGDIAFIDILESMGATVQRTPHSMTVNANSPLHGIDVDMHHISDTVMTLAAIAPLCQGTTRIRNIANIRIKETDRLQACVHELRRLGQEVSFGDDWLQIDPQPITPAAIECYNDHRMAMSFAVLGAVHGGITITDPACVAKTYPGFWDDLATIYNSVEQRAAW